MEVVNTHHAKTHLSQLLERVAKGEEFIIAKAGKPVAYLSAFNAQNRDRTGGQWKGKVHISADFDAPLPDDISSSFGMPS
jgi:antitoxin (DNA-binding transcriptional repressor) of toxin-antitoxin stability system